MRITVWQRQLVKDKETVDSLKDIIDRTVKAVSKRDYDFCILVPFVKDLDFQIRKEMVNIIEKAIEKNITVLTSRGYGPGASCIAGLFNFSRMINVCTTRDASHVNFIIDGDQFDIDRDEVLNGIEFIAKGLIQNNLLFGVGARNEVLLGSTEEFNSLRQIEEMFFAKFVGKIKVPNPFNVDLKKLPESYKKFGDPVPGVHALNTSHPSYLKLMASVVKACQKADLTRYAGDPYVLLKAHQLSKDIISVYVPTRKSLPPVSGFDIETFRKKNFELGKTDLGRKFLKVVSDKSFEKELADFYPIEQIKKVKDLIISGLKEGLTAQN
jgi:hypothetical protein